MNVRTGSVRQARVEAGLSLAQLGHGHVTAPAIYLIETGRTRPSLPTLEHIAKRTGKPVEFFLAQPPSGDVDEAKFSLLSLIALVSEGRTDKAIKLGKWLLEQSSSAPQLDRIRYLLGRAYSQAAESELAAPLLDAARAHFQAVNDRELLAECIANQAALAIAGHARDAAALAREALTVCRSLSPAPRLLEARILGILAAAHAANHDWEAAVPAYEQAIAAASPLLDLRQAAHLYSRLGAAYHELGEVQTAARHVMRSIALHEILHDRLLLGRAENGLGQVLMARGDLVGARRHFDRALEVCDGPDHEFGRGQVLLSLSEVSLLEDKLGEAHDFARQALAHSQQVDGAAAVAEAHVLLARIADRRSEHRVADSEFEEAIARFETLGMTERLHDLHLQYAEVLERRGELPRAYAHMKQALEASRTRSPGRQPEQERVSSA